MAYYFSFFFFPDGQISFDLDSLCLDFQNNNNKINKENNKKKVLHWTDSIPNTKRFFIFTVEFSYFLQIFIIK